MGELAHLEKNLESTLYLYVNSEHIDQQAHLIIACTSFWLLLLRLQQFYVLNEKVGLSHKLSEGYVFLLASLDHNACEI